MRILLTILSICLLACPLIGRPTADIAKSVVTIDMRHGLPESRIRAIKVLPDGRVAIATAGYISVFDGTSFVNEAISLDNVIALATQDKNRQLYCDSSGVIWLKTPITRHNSTARLLAFDPRTAQEITQTETKRLKIENIKDFYIDNRRVLWMIDNANRLNMRKSAAWLPVINLDNLGSELPSVLYNDGNSVYLCYNSGNVCVVDIAGGHLKYMVRPELPVVRTNLTNSGAKWHDGKLWLSYHRHNDHANTWVASLDSLTRSWQIYNLKQRVFDYIIEDDSVLTAFPGVDQGIYCVEQGADSSLWAGMTDSGLRYLSTQKAVKIYPDSVYPFAKSGYFPNERARELADKYARGILNCSDVDTTSGFVYLGTRKGLVVIDDKGRQVALLDENVGLQHSNVQSVVANVGATKGTPGDIWFSTTTGFSRLRHVGRDSFDIIHLGILDGIELNGRELPSQSIVRDSSECLIAGFPGGVCTIDPAKVSDEGRVVFHFPDDYSEPKTNSSPFVIALLCTAVVACAIGFYVYGRKRKHRELADSRNNIYDRIVDKCRNVQGDNAVNANDREFAEKIDRIIEEHIDDEELSVVSLSRMMAMDRTNLYRKMQTIMGVSPSVYIRHMRLKAASRLLKETDLPVSEIAMRTGFSSAKYFSSTFKEVFGILPAKFREQKDQ